MSKIKVDKKENLDKMKTKIKICGLRRPEDIQAVNQYQPDFIGFLFYEKSKRYISREYASTLKQILDEHICAVGVFVNEKPELVAQIANEGIIDWIQLHGAETEEYIQRMRQLTDKPIVKAFGIKEERDLEKAECSSADYLLLDSGSGGTGMPFDWSCLGKMKRPYFLAGGLSNENVGEVIERFAPYAVDVSSRVETDGWKDAKKIEQFILAARKIKE
ncbi:MAG: phosphoribosylanthranilate isomerase [Lachnospiraceae bacterium]